MRAILQEGFGGPEVLVHRDDVPDPTPGPGDVLVATEASGVCGFDLMARRGLEGYGHTPPFIPGHEFAGRVVQVGTGVRAFSVGDRVAAVGNTGCHDWSCSYCRNGRDTICAQSRVRSYGSGDWQGAYAELVVADATSITTVPEGVGWADASIAACAIGTVVHALKLADFRPGERVLVTGAGGGLGLHALQLVRAGGGEAIAVTSSPAKLDVVSQYADRVVLLRDGEYDAPKLDVDLVVENTAGATLNQSLRTTRRGGRIVITGNLTTTPVPFSPGAFLVRELEMIGSYGANLDDLDESLAHIAAGTVRPVIGEIVPFDDPGRAHRLMDERKALGKVVYDVLGNAA